MRVWLALAGPALLAALATVPPPELRAGEVLDSICDEGQPETAKHIFAQVSA